METVAAVHGISGTTYPELEAPLVCEPGDFSVK